MQLAIIQTALQKSCEKIFDNLMQLAYHIIRKKGGITIADLSQCQFYCPQGRHTGEFKWDRTYLIYAYGQDDVEVWWCGKCKEHFVREGKKFYPLLWR